MKESQAVFLKEVEINSEAADSWLGDVPQSANEFASDRELA
jgi:hypothetical protein